MSYSLSFETEHRFNAGEPGISIPITLQYGDVISPFTAKLDTGSSFCIFERIHGEMLGLDVERGERQQIGTAIGSFITFGHEVTISALGFSFDSVVYFAQDENFRRNVLGRHGWLNKIKLGLIDYDGLLYLSHYDNE